jgi:NADPH-dependent 2,4-dienoyl-CoA reductase/sulfur reductase-like enzyme
MPSTIVVIGGGPAGMMAAINARANGARVILIEKNLYGYR